MQWARIEGFAEAGLHKLLKGPLWRHSNMGELFLGIWYRMYMG